MPSVSKQVLVTLPDGAVMQCDHDVTPLQVAEKISPRLAKAAVAGKIDGEVVDLNRPIERDSRVEILTLDSEEGLEVMRHSTAHVMAQAILRLYPGTKLAIGPVIKDGFYYDIDCPQRLTVEDLPKIEAEMARIVQENHEISREEISKQHAVTMFREMDEAYKLEIIEDLEDGHITLYRQGEFVDLCRGPHIPSTGAVKEYKLTSIAGAYWRGDSDRQMLTRIYGTAWPKKAQLQEHLQRIEEAAKRDHRRLGPQLDLFSFHEEAPGFVFWHPKGHTLYRTLENFSRQLQEPLGYEEVATPWIMRWKLWETSGHADHYQDNIFIIESEGEKLGAKPMNCPAHCVMFRDRTRSYRDLPLKIAEYSPLSRYEPSGTLHGLLRVRGFHQDDAHLFVRPDQIEEQIKEVLELVDTVYRTFGMTYTIKLSTRPDDFMGEAETWDRAEQSLIDALASVGADYVLNPGDGAFYGPKLDFDVTDALGRTWQCATVQLDFQMPENFDLTYVDQGGEHRRPVMIHRAIVGSMERFLGILVEHYAGAFPLWLSPEQVRVIPIGEDYLDYGEVVLDQLRKEGIRAEVDRRNEKVGYKIRDAQVNKVPYMLIVGQKEATQGTVSVRERKEGDLGAMELSPFIAKIKGEIQDKV